MNHIIQTRERNFLLIMIGCILLFGAMGCSPKVFQAFDNSSINRNGIWIITDTVHHCGHMSRYINREPVGYECGFMDNGTVFYSYYKLGHKHPAGSVISIDKYGRQRTLYEWRHGVKTEYHYYF